MNIITIREPTMFSICVWGTHSETLETSVEFGPTLSKRRLVPAGRFGKPGAIANAGCLGRFGRQARVGCDMRHPAWSTGCQPLSC
eukprot:3476134-Pyramimonas_sp.AAC.1